MKENNSEVLIPQKTVTQDAENGLRFSPPVYVQRYCAVEKVLNDDRWQRQLKKVVDFGCAEMHFFPYLRNIGGIEHILEIDIDGDMLENIKFRVDPLISDYLKKRTEPLNVTIAAGSISDPDPLLTETDAVVAIEIIEHVFPDVFEAVPYNIFGFIKPRVAIFTTPNADFNVLFTNSRGFRHYDHKFEWSRVQFEDWANNITSRFPEYSVTFQGIGSGPNGTEDVGCCSQMAIFVKESSEVSNLKDVASYGICTYMSYTLKYIKELHEQRVNIENKNNNKCSEEGHFKINCNQVPQNYFDILHITSYPVYEDHRTKTEKVLDEVMYWVSRLGGTYGCYYNDERNRSEVPVSTVEPYLMDCCELSELKTILLASDWILEECVTNKDVKELCLIYDPNDEFDSESSHSEQNYYLDDTSYIKNNNSNYSSDWDEAPQLQNDAVQELCVKNLHIDVNNT